MLTKLGQENLKTIWLNNKDLFDDIYGNFINMEYYIVYVYLLYLLKNKIY